MNAEQSAVVRKYDSGKKISASRGFAFLPRLLPLVTLLLQRPVELN